MHPLTVDELRRLMEPHRPPCISIYLPTRRGGAHEDKKRFEGLVRRAREQISADGIATTAANELFAPLVEMAGSPVWSPVLDGVALFRSQDTLVQHQLPYAVPELVVVSESFHIRPLIAFLQSNRNYYLLNLSQNFVAFYKGDANGLTPIDLSSLPKSLTDALGFEDRERHMTFHFGARGGQNPIYGGLGKTDTSRDEDLARFYRTIDESLWEVLRDEKAPLVLAATDRSNSMYRTIARYPHLAAEGIIGNYSRAGAAELHEKAWPIVQKEVTARETELLERYQSLVSRSKALDEVRAIAKFAVQGRVRELLLAKDAYQWGILDKTTGDVAFHDKPEGARDEDVLDDIAESVLLKGGDVYSLSKDHMPSKSSVAATLRW